MNVWFINALTKRLRSKRQHSNLFTVANLPSVINSVDKPNIRSSFLDDSGLASKMLHGPQRSPPASIFLQMTGPYMQRTPYSVVDHSQINLKDKKRLLKIRFLFRESSILISFLRVCEFRQSLYDLLKSEVCGKCRFCFTFD